MRILQRGNRLSITPVSDAGGATSARRWRKQSVDVRRSFDAVKRIEAFTYQVTVALDSTLIRRGYEKSNRRRGWMYRRRSQPEI